MNLINDGLDPLLLWIMRLIVTMNFNDHQSSSSSSGLYP